MACVRVVFPDSVDDVVVCDDDVVDVGLVSIVLLLCSAIVYVEGCCELRSGFREEEEVT